MVVPDDGGKLNQNGMINNILQWTLLTSVCIYLVLTRREPVHFMGSMEQVTLQVLKNEEATKRNDVRITTLERMASKFKLEYAMLGKTELQNVLFGWYRSFFLCLPLIPFTFSVKDNGIHLTIVRQWAEIIEVLKQSLRLWVLDRDYQEKRIMGRLMHKIFLEKDFHFLALPEHLINCITFERQKECYHFHFSNLTWGKCFEEQKLGG